MYTEDYGKRGFPIRDFILKLILVVVFALLLVFLLPKVIVPKLNTSSNNTSCNCKTTKCDMTGVNALSSQIFSDNLERMKNAAISYYTNERLPKEVGQSSQMTLKEMIEKHIITTLIDKNGKAVDQELSYVKITKLNDEYTLKINIKDSEKEDYIIVHLGCYNYCEANLCQKQTDNTVVPIKGSKPQEYIPVRPIVTPSIKYYCSYINGKYYDANGNVVTKEAYNASCTTPVEEKHYCVFYNNNYYGKYGTVVSESDYINQCTKPVEERHYCVYYNNNYYGKYGTVVTEDDYIDQCTKPIDEKRSCVLYNDNYYNKEGKIVNEVNYLISCYAPKCKIVNGYYFGKNGKNVAKSIYTKECTTPVEEQHTCVKYDGKLYDNKNGKVVDEPNFLISCYAPKCKKVNGYYFGKNGNNVTKATYEKECNKEYLYEYQRVVEAKVSEWTPWSQWTKTDCATKEVNCNENDLSCLFKLQIEKRKEQIGTYDKTYAVQREELRQTGSYEQKSCKNYEYIIINNKTYVIATTTTYTTVTKITKTTTTKSGNWVYQGRSSYANPPRDTATTHYEFVGADYSSCSSTCQTAPRYYYDKYTYSGDITEVSTTRSCPKTHVDQSTKTKEQIEQEEIARCGEYVTKTIPIFATITVTDAETRKEPLYGTICYQSTKSRNVISKGKVEKTWSTYDNKELLNNGWTYTGNTKLK